MAIIQVDYEDMLRNVVVKVQNSGFEMYKDIEKVRNLIQNMGTCWTGERYNSLVNEFNNMIQRLNKILKITCNSLPNALSKIGSNYAKADESSIAIFKGENRTYTINALSMQSKVLSFNASQVTQLQQNISQAFQDCISRADEIEQACYHIVWEGQAAKAFYSKIGKIKTSLSTSFEDIKQRINDYITQASAEMEVTELKNTVNNSTNDGTIGAIG